MKRIYQLFASASMGLSIGILINLVISASKGRIYLPAAPAYLAQFSNQNVAVAMSLLVYAALGIFSYLCSLLYDNEKIKLPYASLIHILLTLVALLSAGFYLKWFPVSFASIVSFTLVALLIQLLIWGGFYFHYKARIKKFNAAQRDRQP